MDAPSAKYVIPQSARHLGWLLIERAGRTVLVFAVGLLVARHLGPASLGTLSVALALITLLAGWAQFGLDGVLSRDVLLDPERTRERIASAAVLRSIVGVAAWGLVLSIAWATAPSHGTEALLLWVLSPLVLLPSLMLPDIWLRARLHGRTAAAAQLMAAAFGAVLRVTFVAVDAPLSAFAAATVIEGLAAAWLVHLLARREGLRAPWRHARRATVLQLARECWPLALSGVAVVVYMKIDELMLRLLLGPAEVGWYTAATRFTEIWFFLPAAIASSLLPRLIEARGSSADESRREWQRSYDLQASTAYAIALPLSLAAPWLITLAYGPDFGPSAPVMVVHVWSLVFVFLGIARGQWLVQQGHGLFYLFATLTGAGLNIGLNFVTIPRWGGVGAALSTLVSFAVGAWLSGYAYRPTRATASQQSLALAVPFRIREVVRSL